MERKNDGINKQINSNSSKKDNQEYRLQDNLDQNSFIDSFEDHLGENIVDNTLDPDNQKAEDNFSTIDSSYYSSIESPETDPSLDYKLRAEDRQTINQLNAQNSSNVPKEQENEDFFNEEEGVRVLNTDDNNNSVDDLLEMDLSDDLGSTEMDNANSSDFISDEADYTETNLDNDFDSEIKLDDLGNIVDDSMLDNIPNSDLDSDSIDLSSEENEGNESFFGDLDSLGAPTDNIADDISLDNFDNIQEGEHLVVDDLEDESFAQDTSAIENLNNQIAEENDDIELNLDEPVLEDLESDIGLRFDNEEEKNSFNAEENEDHSVDDLLEMDLSDDLGSTEMDNANSSDFISDEADYTETNLDNDFDSEVKLDDLGNIVDDSMLDNISNSDLDSDSIDLSSEENEGNESFFGDLDSLGAPTDNIVDDILLDNFDNIQEGEHLVVDDLEDESFAQDTSAIENLNNQIAEENDELDLPQLDIDGALNMDDFQDHELEEQDQELDSDDSIALSSKEDEGNESFFGDLDSLGAPTDNIADDILLDTLDDIQEGEHLVVDDFDDEPMVIEEDEEIEFNPDGTPKNKSISPEWIPSSASKTIAPPDDFDDDEIEFNDNGTPKNKKNTPKLGFGGMASRSVEKPPPSAPVDYSEMEYSGNLGLEGLQETQESDPFNIGDDHFLDTAPLDMNMSSEAGTSSDNDFSLDDIGDEDSYSPIDNDNFNFDLENSESSSNTFTPTPSFQTTEPSSRKGKLKPVKKEKSRNKDSIPKWKQVVFATGVLFSLGVGLYIFLFTEKDGALQRGLNRIANYDYETANGIFENETPSIKWHNKYAKAFMDHGNYKYAEEKLIGIRDEQGNRITKGAIDLNSTDKETLLNIAKLFVLEKQFEKAFAINPGPNNSYPVTLSYLERKYPQNYEVLDTIGQSYVEWGKNLVNPSEQKQKFAEASNIYHNILRSSPKNNAPFSRLLEISLLTNDRLEERLNQMKMRGIDGSIDTITLAKIGQYYLDKEQLSNATYIFQLLSQRKDGDHPIIFETIGRYYAASQDFGKAEENLIKGIKSNSIFDENRNFVAPKDSLLHAQLNNEIGQIYVHYIGQFPGTSPSDLKQRDRFKSLARFHYNEAKRYNRDNPHTYYLSGNLQYAIEKNYSNAILDFEKSYSMLRERNQMIPSDLSFNLGNSLYKKANYEQALNILSEVRVKTQLQYPSLEYLIGMTYMKLGVNSEAVVKMTNTLDYLNDAVNNAKTLGMPRTLYQNKALYLSSITKNNIGAIYQKEGDLKNSGDLKNQARSYFFQSIDDASHINPQFKIAYPSLNLQNSLLEDNLNFAQNFNIQGRDPLVYEYSPDFIGDYR